LSADGGPSPASRSAADESDVDIDMQDLDDSNVPFEPFKDLCKRRFLWYYDSYLATIQKAKTEVKDNKSFLRMPFEGSSNSMDGKFNYTELERRIRTVKKRLDEEVEAWTVEGKAEVAREGTMAVNLRNQYRQVVESFKQRSLTHHVQLEDDNPFVWAIAYVGNPMTNLESGLFRIKINFSPRFPDEQPRVKFETRIFHHRVATDGTLCYFPSPSRREDVRSHIEAIFAAVEEEEPAYDPRTLVNPEAFKLYWGGPDDRKAYRRRLRRSAQMTTE
jgi:ubiquitin-conjugating enzyme E2 Z